MVAPTISSWLKPSAAARRLGVTTTRVRMLGEAGELVTARDFYGALRFDPEPVERMRRRLEAGGRQITRAVGGTGGAGKAHAKAFRMFAEGAPARDVVIECELTAPAVVELRRQYAELGRDFVISAAGLAELRDVLDWRGEPTERNLLAAIARKIRDSFKRGQDVAADPENHTIEEVTSGKANTGTAGGRGRTGDEIEAPLRVDPQGEAARGARPRDP